VVASTIGSITAPLDGSGAWPAWTAKVSNAAGRLVSDDLRTGDSLDAECREKPMTGQEAGAGNEQRDESLGH
jgi:hypothetical protein